MELNIGICDDTEMFLTSEAKLIQEVCDEQNIKCNIFTFPDGQALDQSAQTFDILFLDIQMPGENGIAIARQYRQRYGDCILFFITSHRNIYLDEAFEVEAFRCYEKPLEKERLSAGMASALRKINRRDGFVELTFSGGKRRLKKHNIIYFYTQAKKTMVVTTSGEYQLRESLKYIRESNLFPGFIEPHNSFFVNEEYVVGWTGEMTNKLRLRYKDKEYKVDLSKRRYADVKKHFFDKLKE